jgi:uncharacterized membrane protein YbhN (UPF0104 family)
VSAVSIAIHDTVERLSTANLVYVAAALALYVASLFIVGARWTRFLRALGGRAGTARAAMATLGGIAVGNLTPSSRLAGEACRIALVRKGGSATWTQATVATIWDRLSEVPPILVLAAMSLVAFHQAASRWRATSAVAGLALVLAAAFVIHRVKQSGVSAAGWRQRLALDRMNARLFAAGVGYSTLLWVQDLLRLACASLAFGVLLSPTRVATLAILAMLGSWVPTVGGVGAIEGGLVAGLVAFGIDVPTAAAITAVERGISYGFSTAAGALVITLVGGRSLWTALRTWKTDDENGG